MIDGPCKWHSGPFKPATHTTRNCSWTRQLKDQGNQPRLPPRPPGGPPPPARGASNDGNGGNGNNNNNGYPQPHAAYHIFETEQDDKHSRSRRSKEVNAIVSPVPQYLNWSETPIT